MVGNAFQCAIRLPPLVHSIQTLVPCWWKCVASGGDDVEKIKICSWKFAWSVGVIVFPVSILVSIEINERQLFSKPFMYFSSCSSVLFSEDEYVDMWTLNKETNLLPGSSHLAAEDFFSIMKKIRGFLDCNLIKYISNS